MLRLIVNILGFNAGWLACILGAANGLLWLGAAVVTPLLGLHLLLTPSPQRAAEARMVLLIALGGALVDTGLHAAGLLAFPDIAGFSIVFPPFIFVMWVNFALTLNVALRWFRRHPILGGSLAAISGPSTYYAGAKLGAVALHPDLWPSLIALSAEWAIVFPLAILAMRRWRPNAGDEAPGKKSSLQRTGGARA